ncbi:acetyl-CoA carboxylase biotin carboxyl carrier protein subunit [Rhizobium sp. TRM95111]|uniref:acetyl-CoA carboxylase biotin carboxyl carrier protein n=1 Tax=Rhizobium alarense TaxID=2846851 RepID=UPI001F34C626|nr:biotin/lipoyl-containing protein [Rhizobium alarense]MCF3640345.1 acetyl-CoA carboxylase biotin carboxyl carrier protein subunit [Rhizobium alarense]
MDFDKLNALMDWMSVTPLSELEWSEGDEHIRLVRANGVIVPVSAHGAAVGDDATPQATAGDLAGLVEAPFFGIVHLTPSPDAPAYIAIGQTVALGDTLCTIEAMKAFNAVSAEHGGVVKEILVKSGEQVSLGQPLFRISAN